MTVQAIARNDPRSRDIVRCRALSDAGQYALRVGRPQEALGFLEESLAIAREIGDQSRAAVVLQPIGVTYLSLGDVDTARRYLAEGLALARNGGDKREIAAALSAMEQIYRVVGDLDAAESASRDVLATMRELDDKQNVGVALTNLAIVSILRKRYDEAAAILREIVEINDRLGRTPFHQWILELAAGIAVGAQKHFDAAKLYGAAEALTERSGRRRDAADALFVASIMEQARIALGDREFDLAVREGATLAPLKTMEIVAEISRHR
jgi:tetratricopeptide (TPR) repeat protein